MVLVLKPSDAELFRDMHARNLAAYNDGARAHYHAHPQARSSKSPACQPPPGLSEDEAYWFNEGWHGRPFTPVTDAAALHKHWMINYPNGPGNSRTS